MNTRDTLQSSLDEACESILPQNTTTDGPVAGEQLRIAAIIGFAGDKLRGTLAVAAGETGLQRVRNELGASEAQAADSLGEMSNLIAGHVKRRLANLGEVVTITPPIVVRGVTIEVCCSGDVSRVESARASDQESIVSWLDYEASPDLALVENPDDESVADGEVLLF